MDAEKYTVKLGVVGSSTKWDSYTNVHGVVYEKT